ncbi:MAG: hypothetical protein H3C49_03245 [Alphaproteobacteria bacterium]|nr:hypothetical protein [Alphaproteobacteria bacterium]HRI75405.1 hypothetical protein [Alphaproteobacteria bacterium]
MTFNMYGSGGVGRHRRQQQKARRKAMMVVIFLVALAGASFWWGAETERTSQQAFKEKARELEKQRAGLESMITNLRSEVQSTQVRYQQLETKYQQEVPQGEFKNLTDLVRKQLGAGIKPERLAFVIEAARPPKNCSEPSVKRFVVKTPVYNGPHGTVSFGNGVVTVTGEGEAATNSNSMPEAWYDPGKPVKIVFIEIGGKRTVKEGLLPVQHSLVIGNKEYRFTVAAGDRSFISVTSDNCDYP